MTKDAGLKAPALHLDLRHDPNGEAELAAV
jgi:hypothetical protein